MAIIIGVSGPTHYEGVPGSIQVRASGDYSPDVFDDLANRLVDLFRALWMEDEPEKPGDNLPMPHDPEYGAS